MKKDEASKIISETINTFVDSPEDIIEFSSWLARNSYAYSLRNSILIKSQNMGAICCQSLNAWHKAGYRVKEEEFRKGASVFVPQKITFVDVDGDGKYEKKLSDLTKEEKAKYKAKEYESRSKTCFGIGFTYDISQTDCPPEEWNKFVSRGMDSVKHAAAWEALKKYTIQCGIPVYDGDDEKEIHGVGLFGFCTHDMYGNSEVHLAKTLKDTQKLSVGGHEIGHALMHGKREKPRSQMEVEADIFSILVNTHFGIEIEDTRKRHLKDHFGKLEFKDGADRDKEITKIVDGVFTVYKKYIAEVDKLIAA